ncbi:hypothetical protein CR162_05955 [Pseudoroseomonas rhizosphaerae]|uniref:Uncharacterized protein n=1 Tax=Teichococcus rhizosphaerae TaxID=1335062 RepID=A0A2C7ACW2_9PROT|nr:hypothetical protein [Pseudoroseomonas rhizosphaerae]PHK95879.1 hypothetical protein CR162_05955 [Pseudoroseomonas rhizosphaerae]
MSENLLEPAPEPAGPPPGRPEDVPEKFWDAESRSLRVDALLKSYRELEKRLSQRVAPASFGPPGEDAPEEERIRFLRAMGVPETPEEYAIEPRHEMCGPDAAVNARLHAAGFTCQQVQLVYDLAAERLLPLIAEAAADYEAQKQRGRLAQELGGEEAYQRLAPQIAAWGRANLAPPVFEALSTTAEGVLALHRMMAKGEPGLVRDAEPAEQLDEQALRRMMRDPRYWRAREPEYVKRVTDGFRRLFGQG